MATRTIQKAQAGIEDLLVGSGTTTQQRGNDSVPITKIFAGNLPYSGDDETGDMVSIKTKIDTVNSKTAGTFDTIAENTASEGVTITDPLTASDTLIGAYTSALTNTVYNPIIAQHESTGVITDDIGVGYLFRQENDAGSNKDIASIDAVLVDSTDTSEDAEISIKLMNTGATRAEVARIKSSGLHMTNVDTGSIKVIQAKSYLVNTEHSTTSTIPTDNTKVQSSEGTEFLTYSFTPKSSNSFLEISVIIHVDSSGAGHVVASLFRDSLPDSIQTGIVYIGGANQMGVVTFTTDLIASVDTTARTYKIRFGDDGANTAYINRTTAGSIFNGTLKSGIIIKEILS